MTIQQVTKLGLTDAAISLVSLRRRTKQVIPKQRGFDKYYHMCEEIGRGTQGVTNFVQQIMPIEADQSGHHVVEEADSKYWWLHRGVKESAPTIDPVMIPYR